MAVRGRQQAGRSTQFPSGPLRASAVLSPGDPARDAYEELVTTLGISGAEVLRQALIRMNEAVVSTGRGGGEEQAA